jgi:peptidoglycan-N-acetylglucosamine deacetylase
LEALTNRIRTVNADVVGAVRRLRKDGVRRRPFVFTSSWDDGTIHDLRLAELLLKYQLPATFYIAKQHANGSLEEKHIGDLAKHFELGAHTLSHTVLDSVSDEVAWSEITGSKTWIENVSGKPCQVFCFPQGKFRSRQLRLVGRAGFVGARTVELMSTDFPKLIAGVAMVPTTIQAFPHSRQTYLINAVKRRRIANLRTCIPWLGCTDWLDIATSALNHTAKRGGVFHLWGHSWEIERHRLWQKLEDVLHMAAEFRESGKYETNGQLCSASQSSAVSAVPVSLT